MTKNSWCILFEDDSFRVLAIDAMAATNRLKLSTSRKPTPMYTQMKKTFWGLGGWTYTSQSNKLTSASPTRLWCIRSAVMIAPVTAFIPRNAHKTDTYLVVYALCFRGDLTALLVVYLSGVLSPELLWLSVRGNKPVPSGNSSSSIFLFSLMRAKRANSYSDIFSESASIWINTYTHTHE